MLYNVSLPGRSGDISIEEASEVLRDARAEISEYEQKFQTSWILNLQERAQPEKFRTYSENIIKAKKKADDVERAIILIIQSGGIVENPEMSALYQEQLNSLVEEDESSGIF